MHSDSKVYLFKHSQHVSLLYLPFDFLYRKLSLDFENKKKIRGLFQTHRDPNLNEG